MHVRLRWVTIVMDIWQVSLNATPVLASIIATTAQMILVDICRVLLRACYDMAPVINDLANKVIRRFNSVHGTLISSDFIHVSDSLGSFDQWSLALLLMVIQVLRRPNHRRGPGNTLDVLLLVGLDVKVIIWVLWVDIFAVIHSILG